MFTDYSSRRSGRETDDLEFALSISHIGHADAKRVR